MAAATESILGEQPKSGTPFKLQELITAESHSLHEYRKGKIATFIDEIHRDWIIPAIIKEVLGGQEFIAELDFEELQAVADNLVTNEANKKIKEIILKGEIPNEEEIEVFKQEVRDSFIKDNKKFITILKGEMKDAPIDVYTNIVGKQKYLSAMVDKLGNIFNQIAANPQILDDPRMVGIFNQILEGSGFSPIDFHQKPKQPIQQPQAPQEVVREQVPQLITQQNG